MFFSFFIIFFFFGLYFLNFSGLFLEVSFPYSYLSDLSLVFFFDYISLFFFSFVSLISMVIFLYGKFYMDYNVFVFTPVLNRFFFLLFLFVISMMILIFSGSWLTVMVGWDGLGLVSFLLVAFYNNSTSIDSGFLTIFTNRIGDCFFILGFMFMFYSGWFSFDFISLNGFLVFFIFFLLGAVTKSAQFPFSSWLPAAMAAPTPVSSLVHSSTLVTAGVYLIVRFNYLLEEVYSVLMVLSIITVFFAGLAAVCEYDFKKIVAMSTLSQLGFMMFSISLGFWNISFIHMVFHAFFKSSLFLSSGTLMHYVNGGQDFRLFGSFNLSFFSKMFFSICCLSLMGFPFFLGYYTKETIIGLLLSNHSFLTFMLVLGCCFTVAYSFRLIFIGFFYYSSCFSSLSLGEDWYYCIPIIFIYIFCVFLGNFFFSYFGFLVLFSFFEFFVWMIVISIGYIIYKTSHYFTNLYTFFTSLGFLSIIMSSVFSSFISKFSYKYDYTWSEYLGGKGFNYFFIGLNNLLLYIYNLSFVFFLFFFIISYMFFSF